MQEKSGTKKRDFLRMPFIKNVAMFRRHEGIKMTRKITISGKHLGTIAILGANSRLWQMFTEPESS